MKTLGQAMKSVPLTASTKQEVIQATAPNLRAPTTISLPDSLLRLLRNPWDDDAEGQKFHPWCVPKDLATQTREEVRRLITDYRRAIARPSREDVAFHVMKLLAHYWTPAMDANLNSALAQDWVDDLGMYCLPSIVEACAEWRRSDKQFRPKPGELMALAARHQRTYENYLIRMDAILNYEPRTRIEVKKHYREISRPEWNCTHFFEKIHDLIGFSKVFQKNHKPVEELEFLLTACRFAEEARGKFTDAEPEMNEIYSMVGQAKPRIEILEKRFKEIESEQGAKGDPP